MKHEFSTIFRKNEDFLKNLYPFSKTGLTVSLGVSKQPLEIGVSGANNVILPEAQYKTGKI